MDMLRDRMSVSVSFCTTCMGRLHHLKETLEKNVNACRKHGFSEVVLLDYSSPDNLAGWIQDTMLTAISEGFLAFYQAFGYEEFSRPHAKNVAHRVARGAIVCNVDADNFAGEGFIDFLLRRFSECEKIILCSSRADDTFGKIAFRKSDFEQLGGYDERMGLGWGHEDRDIIARAMAFGLQKKTIPSSVGFLKALRHSPRERTQFHRIKDQHASREQYRHIAEESIRSGAFIANRGFAWGRARLMRNFSETIEA